MIDLKSIIEKYPECLDNSEKLKAYLNDLYPTEKRGIINVVVAIHNSGIANEMKTLGIISPLDLLHWKKQLEDDYGYAGQAVDTCLDLWKNAFSESTPTAPMQPKLPSKANVAAPFVEENNKQVANSKPNNTIDLNDFEIEQGVLTEYKGNKKDVVIPSSVTSIGESAFWCCMGLTSITIPNSVTSIGDDAFYGCSKLTSITIPQSVTSIGDSAFSCCSGLTSITVDPNNENYYEKNNCIISREDDTLIVGCKNSVIPGSVTSIGDSAFSGCRGLTSITIPDSVTSFGMYAFSSCSGLTNITIPDSVTSIGFCAFRGCSGLTSITIPDGVTSIDYEAFLGCSGLTSVTIPNSVTSIDGDAFYDCTALKDITFKGRKSQWNAISKGYDWNGDTGKYTIHCTDGDISK